MKKSKRVSVSLRPVAALRLQWLAKKNGRSRSAELEAYLETEATEQGFTPSDEEVDAYVEEQQDRREQRRSAPKADRRFAHRFDTFRNLQARAFDT